MYAALTNNPPIFSPAPTTHPRLKTSEFWQNSEVWLRRSALL